MALLQMTWQPQIQQQRRRKGSPPLGLKNLGNSCYLNSVLQCLTYTPPLAQYCLSSHHSTLCKSVVSNRDKECPFCILERRISRSLSLEGSPVDAPNKIQKCITLFAEHFRWGRQEDAHEFLRYVIDACHNTCLKLLKKPPAAASGGHDAAAGPGTVMRDIFGGELLSQVKCLSCKGESNKTDEIMDISLDLFESNSVRDALARFFQPELLDGNNKYSCIKCKKLSVARKQMFILRAPNVLVIQLKRFEGIHGGKINRNIEFEEVLLLSRFMSSTSQDLQPEYNLFGSIVHSGFSPESGHYYAYIKDPSGRWFCCNDANVSLSSTQEVLSEKVYILFYLRNNPSPRSSKTGFPCSSMLSSPNGSSVSLHQKPAELSKPPLVRPNGLSSSKTSASTTLKNGKLAGSPISKPSNFKNFYQHEVQKAIANGNGKHEVHSNGSTDKVAECKLSTINKTVPHDNGSMEKKNAELSSKSSVVARTSDTLTNGTKKMLQVSNGNGCSNLLKENGHEDDSTQSSASISREIERAHVSDNLVSEDVFAMTASKRKLSAECDEVSDIHTQEPGCSSRNDYSSKTRIPQRTSRSEELENFKEVISSEASSDLRSCGWVDRVHDFMRTRKRLCLQETGCDDITELRRQLINDAKKIFNSQIPESLKEHLVGRLRSFSQGKPSHDI